MRKRLTVAATACLVVILAFFFFVPIVSGITTAWCVPYSYSPGDSQSLSVEYFGMGTVHYQGHYIWFYSDTSSPPGSPFQCHDETSTSSST
jgi:hypothetical protein